MIKLTKKELNKKLAEWAGFVEADIKRHYYFEIGGERLPKWQEPGREWHIKLPDFTESLDACFKWLVPKLRDAYSLYLVYNAINDDFSCHIGEVDDEGESIIGETKYGLDILDLPISANAETPALALCLAIEKLIDREVE